MWDQIGKYEKIFSLSKYPLTKRSSRPSDTDQFLEAITIAGRGLSRLPSSDDLDLDLSLLKVSAPGAASE